MAKKTDTQVKLYSFSPLSFGIDEMGNSDTIVVEIPLYFLVSGHDYFGESQTDFNENGFFSFVRCEEPFTLKTTKPITTAEQVGTFLLASRIALAEHFGDNTIVQMNNSKARRMEQML